MNIGNVKCEALTAVAMNVATFWDIAPCSPYVNRCFGGKYHLHLQGSRISRTRNRRVAGGWMLCLFIENGPKLLCMTKELCERFLFQIYLYEKCFIFYLALVANRCEGMKSIMDNVQHKLVTKYSNRIAKAIPVTGRGGL
jgi:hypothetical protein